MDGQLIQLIDIGSNEVGLYWINDESDEAREKLEKYIKEWQNSNTEDEFEDWLDEEHLQTDLIIERVFVTEIYI